MIRTEMKSKFGVRKKYRWSAIDGSFFKFQLNTVVSTHWVRSLAVSDLRSEPKVPGSSPTASNGVVERRCCRRQQNEQICLPQNADFYKTVLTAADLIFARAVDL